VSVSASIAESKKNGRFIRTVYVSPNSFIWEGQKVIVSECWVERTNLVIFKLLVNGRRQDEHRFYRHGTGFLFKEEDSKPQILGDIQYGLCFSGTRQLWALTLLAPDETTHWFHMRHALSATDCPEQVKLRIGTYNYTYSKNKISEGPGAKDRYKRSKTTDSDGNEVETYWTIEKPPQKCTHTKVWGDTVLIFDLSNPAKPTAL
jgi:hypothetical protein